MTDSVITQIPDILNHESLLRGLQAIRAEVESRLEDGQGLASWSAEMSSRMEMLCGELQQLNVDSFTVGNVAALADAIGMQNQDAQRYVDVLDTTAGIADTTSSAVQERHGRIADAVDDSPVHMATASFYNAE